MNMTCRCLPQSRGHSSFRAHLVDAPRERVASDPTGTMPLQRRFKKAMDARWKSVRKMLPTALVNKIDAINSISHASMTGQDPVRAFQAWIDSALEMVVLGSNGSWTLPYVRGAGDIGVVRALRIVEKVAVQFPDRTPALQTLCITELQGIMEAVSQQCVRALANGLLTNQTPSAIGRAMQQVIDKTGVERTDLLISFIVVRTFGAATLDVFRAAGVPTVGTIAERTGSSSPRAHSGLVRDAKKKKRKDLVNVLTAGDDKVCPACEDISEEGPYTLAEAEALIPAHPRCRCAFVPWGDARYAHDAFDPNQPRDKNGMWAKSGGGDKTYYHGTVSSFLSDVKKYGLVPASDQEKILGKKSAGSDAWAKEHGLSVAEMAIGDRAASVYITPNYETAKSFSGLTMEKNTGAKPVVLKIAIPSEHVNAIVPDEESTKDLKAFRFKGAIKPEWITEFHHIPPKSIKKMPVKDSEDLVLYGVVFVNDDIEVHDAFNPNQPRDKDGQWTAGGGSEHAARWAKEGDELGLTSTFDPETMGDPVVHHGVKVGFDAKGFMFVTRSKAGAEFHGEVTSYKIKPGAKIYADLEASTKRTGYDTLLGAKEQNSSGIVHKRDLILVVKDEWNENLHPRDKDGKFKEKGTTSEKLTEIEKQLKKLGAPMWTHELDPDPDAGHLGVEVPTSHVEYFKIAAKKMGLDIEENDLYEGEDQEDPHTFFSVTNKPVTTPSTNGTIDMANMTKVGEQMGSNKGGVYEGPFGDKYYIKEGKSLDHVQNELLAAKLYQAAGSSTMQYVPVKGDAHVATVLDQLDKNNVSQFDDLQRQAAQKDFAVHAWLANHDAVGTGGDNQVVPKGTYFPATVDVGGSLKYRAQGEPKGDLFGNTVPEIDTLRDPKINPDAAKLFGSMTNEEMAASIKRVTDIPDEKIVQVVKASGAKDWQSTASKLIARKNDLAIQAEKMLTAHPDAVPYPGFKTVGGGVTSGELLSGAVDTPPLTFKTKMEHAKHLLEKGTTSEELKKALNWPAIGVPKTAADLNLKLEKTKMPGGAYFYKGTPMTPAEIAAKKAGAAAATAPVVVPFKSAPVPEFKSAPAPTSAPAMSAFDPEPVATPATAEELKKAQKNTKLTAQYVPGAPAGDPQAEALISEFNKKYEGKEYDPATLQKKVADFKKLQADMIPLQKAHAATAAAAAAAVKEAKAKALAKANELPDFDNMTDEEERVWWYNKQIKSSGYMSNAEKAMSKNIVKAAGLTVSEVAYIKAFTGGHSDVNEELRAGFMSEGALAYKHIMNEALAKMPKYNGDTVWRKIQLSDNQQILYSPGKVVHWTQFSSTSKNSGTWSGNTHFTIHKPKSGVDVESISSHPSEAEVIMPADTYYKVLSKKQSGGVTYIEMEEVLPFGKKKKKVA